MARGITTTGVSCQQFTNGNNAEPTLRAFLVALDQWVTNGTEPPPSAVPRRSDKTAAMAVPRPGFLTGVVPQEALGWPTIPGVTYNGLITTRYRSTSGRCSTTKGILSNFPPSFVGPSHVARIRLESGRGRQRNRGDPPAGGRGADFHHDRLGAAPPGFRGERRL